MTLRYSVGYLLSHTLKTVLVIDKPNTGFLNGLGGKIQDGETPLEAMQREFLEETLGADCHPDWKMFCTLTGIDDRGRPFECNFFYAVIPYEGMSATFAGRVIHNNEGDVYIEDVTEITSNRRLTIPNMPWLLLMAISIARKEETCNLFSVKELEDHGKQVQLRAVEERAQADNA